MPIIARPNPGSSGMSGYSGTPLARKLGLKDGMRAEFVDMPANVAAAIAEYGAATLLPGDQPPDFVHIFQTERAILETRLADLRHRIAQNGMIWVSWPKKASKVETDITEDTIREVALPMGLVDIKVCAVDEIWSGLKLVIRKELRGVSSHQMTGRG